MALRDINASKAVPDTYTQLTKLLELPFVRGRAKDAVLQFLTAGVTVYYGEAAPVSSDVGTEWAAGAGLNWAGIGPGWRIDWIYVKETVAAAGAVVVLQGVVDDQSR